MLDDRIVPLKSERIQRVLPPGWALAGSRTVRRWRLPDAALATRWATFLAALAESHGARPRIQIEGRSVELALAAGGPGRDPELRLLDALASL